jgi:hypothetical protein
MAITWQTPGSVAYSSPQGASSISVGYPASNAEGEKLILIIGMKPSTANSGSVTTPGSWNAVTSITGAGGYGSALNADQGNTNLFVYERTVPAGGLSGSLSVTVSNNNICWGFMARLTNSANYVWDSVAGTTGSDIVAGNVDITFGSNPGVTTGDYIIGAMCTPTDVGGGTQFSSEAFVQTGVTFGTVTEINEPYSNTGDDIGGFSCRAAVSSGTGSAAPQMTATAGGTTTNVRGPGVFIRIREKNNLITLTGNNCNQPNTTNTGAVTQERVLTGNNCNQTNTTTTGEVTGPKNLTGNNCNQPNTTTSGGIGIGTTRYWVGGTGNWDGSDTTHWSSNSGGSGGASVPTSTNDVVFDANSNTGTGSFTVSVTATANCLGYKASNLDGAMTISQSAHLNIYGNIETPSSNYTHNGNSLYFVYLKKTSSTATILFRGSVTGANLKIEGGASYSLIGDLTAGNVDVNKGTLDFANYNANINTLTSSSLDARTVLLRSGTITIRSSLSFSFSRTFGGLTFDCGTSTLKFTGATGSSLSGDNNTFYWIQNDVPNSPFTLFIQDSNTYFDWKTSLAKCRFQVATGSTQTFTQFTLTGTAGNLHQIYSNSSGNSFDTSKASGTVSVDYLDLKDNHAVGGATFYAGANSNNGGNTTGWNFSAPSITLTGNNCSQTNQTTTGAISIVKTLTGNDCNQTNQSTTGGITQTHNISGNNCQQVNQSTTGAITKTFTLTGNNCNQTNQSTSSAISQTHILTGNNCNQTNQSSTGGISQNNTLVGNNCSQVNQSTTDAISQTHLIAGNNCNQTNQSSTGAVTKTQTLTGNDCNQTNQSTTGAISQEHALTGNHCNQINQTSTGAITTVQTITGNNVNQTNQSTSAGIGLGNTRYWIGGTGTWNGTDTSHWSDVSGGSGGASVPTSSYNVVFDQNSNSGTSSFTVTIQTVDANCFNFAAQNLDGAMTLEQNAHLYVYGSLECPTSNFTCNGNGSQQIYLAKTSGSATVKWNAATSGANLNQTGTGTYSLARDLYCGNLTIGAGTFDFNNYDASVHELRSSSLDARTISLGNGTITVRLSVSFSFTHSFGGLTLNRGQSTLRFNYADGGATLAGDGNTFYKLQSDCAVGVGTLTVTDSNTYYDLTSSIAESSTKFYTGTTQTFEQFTLTGTPGHLHKIEGFGGAFDTSKTSGTVSIDYVYLKDNHAVGGAAFYAGLNSTNGGNTDGWTFNAPPIVLTGNNCQQANQTTTGLITQERVLTGNDCLQTNQSATGAITQDHALTGNDCQQFNQTTTGAISQTHILVGIHCTQTNRSTTGAVNTTVTLTGNSVEQQNLSTAGAISQTHVLAGNDCAQNNLCNSGQVTVDEDLNGNDVQQVNQSSTGSITQTHLITGNDCQQANQTTTGAITKTYTLTGNDCQQANQTTTGAITQTHALTGDDCQQPNRSTAGAFSQEHVLTGNSLNQVNQSTSDDVTQTHLLTGNDCTQSNRSSTGAIGQAGDLLGNNVTQSNECTTGAIQLVQGLVANDVNQVNQSTSEAINQTHVLAGNSCQQVNNCTTGSISQAGDLVANPVSQYNKSSTGVISQTHYLVGDSVNQVNESITGAISLAFNLTANNVRQINQTTAGPVEQLHILHGLNANQFNRSTTGIVVVQGKLMGADCVQINLCTSDRIYAYPVENALSGSTFKRYRFNPNRQGEFLPTRPSFYDPNRPNNTNVIGPL